MLKYTLKLINKNKIRKNKTKQPLCFDKKKEETTLKSQGIQV